MSGLKSCRDCLLSTSFIIDDVIAKEVFDKKDSLY